jgi:large subunit ribosomal protein L29
MATAAELVLMDPDELGLRLAESRTELLNLRFQVATGQLDNTARMGQVRRDIARILTVMRSREIEEAEGTVVPLAALAETAGKIEEIDREAARAHPGDARYERIVEEDETLVEELVEDQEEDA